MLRLVLDTGERLPCLVDRKTWQPARIATRWAMRYRRNRVQSSTLADNLRILGLLYTWARTSCGFELDDHLTAGKRLTPRQIEAFAATLRMPDVLDIHPESGVASPLIDTGTFDHSLSIIEMFLTWALDSANCGGCFVLTLQQLSAERAQLSYLLQSLRIGARPSERMEPLSDQEIALIRRAIGPTQEPAVRRAFPTRSGLRGLDCETGSCLKWHSNWVFVAVSS